MLPTAFLAAASANAGNYSVTVTNGVSSVTSNVATIAVGSSITSNPTSLALHPAQTAHSPFPRRASDRFLTSGIKFASGGSDGRGDLRRDVQQSYVTPRRRCFLRRHAILRDGHRFLRTADQHRRVACGHRQETLHPRSSRSPLGKLSLQAVPSLHRRGFRHARSVLSVVS